MSNAQVLIQKILKRREFDHDLGDGKSVTLRRPSEVEFFRLARGVDVDGVVRHTVRWSGFKESDLYAGGGSDAVEYDEALWHAVVSDRADWTAACAQALVDAMKRHAEERKAASGN